MDENKQSPTQTPNTPDNPPPEIINEASLKKTPKKTKKVLLAAAAILVLATGTFFLANHLSNKPSPDNPPANTDKGHKITKAPGLTIVPTMLDEINADSAWCGTFQLVWNDMKDTLVGNDIIFTPQIPMAEHLNQATFTEQMLSNDYYYKKWGLKTLALKSEIENGIKDKFDETSDLLDDLDWSEDALDDPNDPNTSRYLFYVMLKRKFEYPKEFTRFPTGKFNGKNNVKYFGIDSTTTEEVKDQIKVLYYNSPDDFAFNVSTKSDDELIFVKSPEGKTFNTIYENINQKSADYKGKKSLQNIDRLMIPDLDFDEKRVYQEFEDKEFPTKLGKGEIKKAIQTIRFSLNEKGGEIKSEAVVDVFDTTSVPEDPPQPRYFYLDNTFALFIREKDQPQPCFAARIDDIEKFQSK